MRIFIVDDTAFIRILCRYHLTKAGHEIVGETYDGAEAVELIKSLQPDCVIVDLALPSKNGVEVMREVQPQFPQIQFIVISALDEDALNPYRDQIHYLTYLLKPFEESALIEAVQLAEEKIKKDMHG